MSGKGWEWVRAQAADDPRVKDIVEATLTHAIWQVKAMDPAKTSRMTFAGGKSRAISLLTKMRSELRSPR